MRFLVAGIAAMLLLSFESVGVQTLGLSVSRIDVTVALVVFLGLRATTLEGAFGAFAVGYLLDVFTGRPTGLFPFLAVLTFLLVRLASSLVDARSRAIYVAFVAAATAGHGLLATFFTWLTAREDTGNLVIPLTGLPLQVLLTAATAFLLWPLLRRFDPANERPEAGVLR